MPDAILCAWQAGQEGGNSVVDVLSGKQSPSGKLTMTWPVKFTDVASSKNFPIDEDPRIDMFSQGKTGSVKNVDYTDYEEDIYVGYRYFDSFDVPVSYPFGYGLSYTTFEYLNPGISVEKDTYKVTVTVKNTGNHEGKEIVQLYVAAPDSKQSNKPVKELKAYAKTPVLKPGQSAEVEMTIKAADLASYDEAASSWIVAQGTYQFLLASSSQDIRQSLTASVKELKTKAHDVMKPNVKLNLLHR